jgi:hypothetical protein
MNIEPWMWPYGDTKKLGVNFARWSEAILHGEKDAWGQYGVSLYRQFNWRGELGNNFANMVGPTGPLNIATFSRAGTTELQPRPQRQDTIKVKWQWN